MAFDVINPTGYTKAVRVVGGHVIVSPGEALQIAEPLEETYVEKLEAAGLVVSPVEPKPVAKPAPKKKAE